MTKRLRANMKAERARKGLSAPALSECLGVSPNQIYRWENAEQEPSSSNLLKMSELYQVSPEYLLQVNETQPPATEQEEQNT